MNKKDLSERDICSKFINPAIQSSGWNMKKQVREEVSFTDGSAALVKHHHYYISGMFLCYALISPVLQSQIVAKFKSTVQSNLFLGKIKELIFPLPPLEEQIAIVEKVNALMGLCDGLEREVKQYQEQSAQLMQSCLRDVFEGESKTVEV